MKDGVGVHVDTTARLYLAGYCAVCV